MRMGKQITSLLLALGWVLVAAGGCAGPGPERASTDQGASLRLEKVAELGCSDCEGAELLTVATLTVSPDGRVFLIDRYEPLVRVLDLQGELLLTFGKYGQGPGEMGLEAPGVGFIPPIGIYPGENGGWLVLEGMPSRVQQFDTDGNYIGRVRLPQAVPIQYDYSVAARRLYVISFLPGQPRAIKRFDDWDQDATEGTRIGGEAAEFYSALRDRGVVGVRGAFAAAPDGSFVIADPIDYRIQRFDADGNLVAEFGRDIERPRKSEEELRQERQRLEEVAARRGRQAQEPDPLKPHFTINPLDYDDAGRLWVRTPRGGPDETIFDVFDATNEFIGEVVVPVTFKLDPFTLRNFDVGGGHLAAVLLDQAGTDQVKIWRVIAEPGRCNMPVWE
ncbi:MAG: hypothetical protein ACE5HV_02390 [Acidobacteriota bacterium]